MLEKIRSLRRSFYESEYNLFHLNFSVCIVLSETFPFNAATTVGVSDLNVVTGQLPFISGLRWQSAIAPISFRSICCPSEIRITEKQL